MDARNTESVTYRGLGQAALRNLTADATLLHAAASSGAVAVDPDSALGIAKVYDQMVDEIHWIKIGMLAAGQHPKLGTSPYATRVATYQHEAAEAFLDVVTELQSACRVCAEAFRESAVRYAERDGAVADELNRAGRTE